MVPSADRFTYFHHQGRQLRVVAAMQPGGSVYLQWRGDGFVLLTANEWSAFEAGQRLELLGTGADDVPLDFSEGWEVDGEH